MFERHSQINVLVKYHASIAMVGGITPFIKVQQQLAGSYFQWSPIKDQQIVASIDFNSRGSQPYEIKIFEFPLSADTGYPVRSNVIGTIGCAAPPLALKWHKNSTAGSANGTLGFCCANGYLVLMDPSNTINKQPYNEGDVKSIRFGEDPLLDFEFASEELIFALNKQKLIKWTRNEEQWKTFELPSVYGTFSEREQNYSLSWSPNGVLVAAGRAISLFGNDESITNLVSYDAKIITQMKWNPHRENSFAVSYANNNAIEFFDLRKLDVPYQVIYNACNVTSFDWGRTAEQFINVDDYNIATRWESGKIISQQFVPNGYDVKYSPHDSNYFAAYGGARTWVYKAAEHEQAATVAYLDSDQLLIDSDPEDVLSPPIFTRIDLRKLRDQPTKEKEIKKLCDEVHRRSYAVISLPEELFQKFILAREIFKQFCALDESAKRSIAILPGRDVGYNHIPNVKEFFQMRRVAEEEKFPWPPGLPSFREKVSDIWEFQEELSREIMSYLAIGIGVSPQKFLELMDPLKLPANEFSHSIMGLYHYFQHNDLTETCYAHQDMGLISFIPRSEVAGLQVVDYDSNMWLDIEKTARSNDVVMIVCETLDRITGGYYPVNNHRVVGTTDRHSIVFKLRARNDAVIDTPNLGSPLINAILAPEHKVPLRVGDFVSRNLQSSESINFPGSSFDNYKNCILNPNVNYTGLRSENTMQMQSDGMYM